MTNINPKVLTWARETAGLTVDDAARTLGFEYSRKRTEPNFYERSIPLRTNLRAACWRKCAEFYGVRFWCSILASHRVQAIGARTSALFPERRRPTLIPCSML